MAAVLFYLLFCLCLLLCCVCNNYAMNNGLARTPPMGWDTYNLYKGNFNATILQTMADYLISTGMTQHGYNRINVDGGWVWVVNDTWMRNASGYVLADPHKFPNGIQQTIEYVQSRGLLYGHYTNAGVNACGNAMNSSQYFMTQDISLFADEWHIDMLKIDNCNVVGNDTEIIFEWSQRLNATGRPILLSDCRNQCQNDAQHKRVDWKPYCINITNTWRISTDINPGWGSMLHNLDCGKSFGKWAQPGAWTDLDFLEIDIGNFHFTGHNTSQRLRMNEAHFSLWAIVSAPLIAANNLTNMDNEILRILTNKYAIAVNQQYVYNAGDVITEFNISHAFREQYMNETIANLNMTEMFFKPFAANSAAFVFLNRNTTLNFSMRVQFKDLYPLMTNGKGNGNTDTDAGAEEKRMMNNANDVQCNAYDIWSDTNFTDTEFKANLLPSSVKFIIISECSAL